MILCCDERQIANHKWPYPGTRCADPRSQTKLPPAISASDRIRTSGEKNHSAFIRCGVRSTRTKPRCAPSMNFRCGIATRIAAVASEPLLDVNIGGGGELMAGVTSSTASDPPPDEGS